MQIELGQTVYSSDGQNIGVVKHLIMDPDSGEVKILVVERGWFLPEDVEVPLDAIERGDGDALSASYTVEQVKRLPRFDETAYTSAYPEQARSFLGFPFRGALWPVAYPMNQFGAQGYPLPAPVLSGPPDSELPTEVQEYLWRQDEENAVISEGADVYSKDNEKIGEVHRLTFDDTTGHPLRLVVRSGWFFPEDRELPADAIASVDDGVIYLNLYRDQIDKN